MKMKVIEARKYLVGGYFLIMRDKREKLTRRD